MAKHPTPPPGLTVITGTSGHLEVASDTLLAGIERLHSVSGRLNARANELLALADRSDVSASIASAAPYAAIEAHRVMEVALRELRAAQHRALALSVGIRRALNYYNDVERGVETALHVVGEQVAWGAGFFLRMNVVPFAVFAAPIVGMVLSTHSGGAIGSALQGFLKAHGRILTNRYTVAEIRELASVADGFGLGFLGVPPNAATALEQTGATNVKTSAAGVIALGNSVGLLKETPVSVRKTSTFTDGRPPTSLVDRANSFPVAHDDPNGEQIRIDRYSRPGLPDRYDVYIGGTATFDPKATTQPFDFTSDMHGVANLSPGSLRAVEQAMAKAGITSSSPVVFNGYSQGGLIASQLAATGHYNVHGVVTFGAPSAQVQIPASVPVLTVRNAEDLVPATAGFDVNPHAVIVERAAFANSAVPSSDTVPAHLLSTYLKTAALADQAQSGEVRSVLDPLDQFGGGAVRVTSTMWLATRVSATG